MITITETPEKKKGERCRMRLVSPYNSICKYIHDEQRLLQAYYKLSRTYLHMFSSQGKLSNGWGQDYL